MSWPSGRERHIDDKLDLGLDWWGKGLKREEMARARRRSPKLLRCLYDSWTLASWSEWLKRRGGTETLTSLVLLHVDDHRDLGSPRIERNEAGWRDLITNRQISLSDPDTVIEAIESGAIGMGSFMTPFLAAVPLAEVRHLCQPPKAVATRDFVIRIEDNSDDLLQPGASRPVATLEPSSGTGAGHYRLTPDVDDWLEGIQGGPLLLHIDMDYFNNRYDGDSDWRERPARLDTPVEKIFAQITMLTQALRRRGLLEVIEDVVFAFSPGFFPAELWAKVDRHLASCLGLDTLEGGTARSGLSGHADKGTRNKGKARKNRVLISEDEVELVRAKGTKGRGGGADGEAWLIQLGGKRAGQVFINLIDESPIGKHASIQIYLNITSQGRGIGSLCYRWACERSKYVVIYAHMQKSNIASARAAEKAGFIDETSAQERQKLMVWRRSSSAASA
ncbi:GNAT family N-acetyltransferase [Rhizobium tumorigenes]|uniref:GNAT family N-acetyltransferase n=1 Tax=Rhizobium tumorigenes TaxID=2041385 RepID=A0AAF1KMR0_9HYPH|nr:GNAT family N-acetyltransferase [Rhizobium tumorigenes]WFR98058.1 GNAT family N-acetyltransferase [Rhizobium tumorigenes]